MLNNSYTRQVFHSLGACKWIRTFLYPMFNDTQTTKLYYLIHVIPWYVWRITLLFGLPSSCTPPPKLLAHPGTLAFGLFVKRYTSLTPQGMKLRNGRSAPPPPVLIPWVLLDLPLVGAVDEVIGEEGVRELNVMVSYSSRLLWSDQTGE